MKELNLQDLKLSRDKIMIIFKAIDESIYLNAVYAAGYPASEYDAVWALYEIRELNWIQKLLLKSDSENNITLDSDDCDILRIAIERYYGKYKKEMDIKFLIELIDKLRTFTKDEDETSSPDEDTSVYEFWELDDEDEDEEDDDGDETIYIM